MPAATVSAQESNVFEINKDRQFDLLREIYISFFANALVFKAGAITGLRYMGCSQRDLEAVTLLEAAVVLLKKEPRLMHANAADLELFAWHVQVEMMDFVQSRAVVKPAGTLALYAEIAHCRQLASRECQYITGQILGSDFLPFEFSDLAKRAFVSQGPMALLSLHVQLSAARAFMLTSATLYTGILKEIQATESTSSTTCYQTYKAYVSLLFVANSFYDIAPEIEISSPESLEEFLDAIRFQFSMLHDESTEQDEHCLELLEKCLSEARAAGVAALRIT